MNIPNKEDYIEAVQADVNAARQKAKAQMSPTEVARLEVIEECAAKLEAAQVPFQLWAASIDQPSCEECGERVGARNHWWYFHKLSYVSKADMTVYNDRVYEAWYSLLPYVLTHQTTHGAVTLVAHSLKTGRAISVHSRGECQFLPLPPPDLPTCDFSTPLSS